MRRRNLTTLMCALFGLVLTSCNGGGLIKPDYKTEGVKLGILKYVNDAPLNEAENAFLQTLDEAKIQYTVNKKDGNAEANMTTSAALDLVSNCNLVLAIATPAATAVQAARDTKSRMIPTLFTAVTDPVSAGLVKANDQTDQNITGTSDMNPVADQIQLFKDINPNITKVGIIYNLNETNSAVQLRLAEAKCKDLGLTLEKGGFNAGSEILSTINGLVNKGIQGLYIPTDNVAVSNFPGIIKPVCDTNKILVVAGEGTVVKNGAIASRSLSYAELGKKTAQQAIEIISGKDVSEVHVSSADKFPLIINKTHADELKINIPAALLAEKGAEII